ncbi:MAG: hypothetical protein ACOZQL_07910 [Myxococcota bacterium]
MLRHVMMGALFFASVVSAQPLRNRVEKAKDRQDLRQDRRQLADDRLDAARAAQLLRDYDAAAAANDAARLGAIDQAFNAHLAREIAESKVESAQARQEVREDKRELASDRRELRQDVAVGRRPGVVADDARDKARDRANLADDRADAARERLSRERLLAIQAQLGGLAGRFDPPSVATRRQLYAEVVGQAVGELQRDKAERREDRRELREDRRETREDRRDPLR